MLFVVVLFKVFILPFFVLLPFVRFPYAKLFKQRKMLLIPLADWSCECYLLLWNWKSLVFYFFHSKTNAKKCTLKWFWKCSFRVGKIRWVHDCGIISLTTRSFSVRTSVDSYAAYCFLSSQCSLAHFALRELFPLDNYINYSPPYARECFLLHTHVNYLFSIITWMLSAPYPHECFFC